MSKTGTLTVTNDRGGERCLPWYVERQSRAGEGYNARCVLEARQTSPKRLANSEGEKQTKDAQRSMHFSV